MRARELASLVVTLLAVWQPSAARPQLSDIAHESISSGVEGTDLILDGTSAVDVRGGGVPAVDVPVNPQTLSVDRTGLIAGSPEASKTFIVSSLHKPLLSHEKSSSGESSSGGGGFLNLLSSLVSGSAGSVSQVNKNPLSALGLGQDTLQSFVQLASSSADDIGRETNFGLRLLGDELEFQGQQRLKHALRGVQQAGRTVGAVGQNTYRGVLQTKDSLGNLAAGTVQNLGEFADDSVTASFDKVSDTLGAFGRLLHDLKTAFLKRIIAQAEAGKELVENQSKTTSVAVKEILDDKRDTARDNIRAITGLKKEIKSKRIYETGRGRRHPVWRLTGARRPPQAMRARVLASVVVALLAVWQPSAARPQTSQPSDIAHVPISSGVEGPDLILDGTPIVDVRVGGVPAVDVPVNPQTLSVHKRTGRSAIPGSSGLSAGDPGPNFGQNLPALSGGGTGSSGFTVQSDAVFGAASSGFPGGSGIGSGGFGGGSSELTGAGFGAGSAGFSGEFGAGSAAPSAVLSDAGTGGGISLGSAVSGSSGTFGTQDIDVPISSQGSLRVEVPSPGASVKVDVDSFANLPQSSGEGALGKFVGILKQGGSSGSGQSSSGGGGILNVLSSLLSGSAGSVTQVNKNPLSALGLGQDTLQSFVQIASSSADDIARETNFGLRLLGDEVEFQGQQRLKQALRGVQQAGRTVGAVGQNTYRGVLQTKDSLGSLASGTVQNLGEFADDSVTASFDKVSDTLGAFGRLLHDLKTAFFKNIIAHAEAGQELVDNQSKTTSGAVEEIIDDKRNIARDNIRAITGLKKEIKSKRI
nr:uncharacterized protein LOC123759546 [Procambarus clarkii]